MPFLTSTTLSDDDSTLIVTSPAPASFFFKNELILFSKYVPNLVVGNPTMTQKFILSILSKIDVNRYQLIGIIEFQLYCTHV